MYDEVAATTAVVDVSNVSYAYGTGLAALREVSFTVGAGERIAIVGATGSGKSTILRMLGGLIFPDCGTVTAFGQVVSSRLLGDEAYARSFRRRIGMVFQNSDAQLFCATVREEISFGVRQLGLPGPEAEQRISDVCTMLDVASLLDRARFSL